MALQSPQAIQLKTVLDQMTEPGELYRRLDDGRLLCYACGHECKIPEGRAGVCRVRFNDHGTLMTPSGYVGGIACDPIEKKPFYHAFPGRDALSFGMLGCDLHCGYCQNWITSQALRDDNAVADVHRVTPTKLMEFARQYRTPVIASTYNEPLITAEWASRIMLEGQRKGLVGAFVSNGNATRQVLEYLQPCVQLYKVDLKTFSAHRYRELGGQLENVKRTLVQLHEMGFWVEVVTLLVPGFNDSEEELKAMTRFLADISPDIPWHVTGFHSDYRMKDTPSTTTRQLIAAAEIGTESGLRYVYAGNRPGQVGHWEHTRCPACGGTVIERYGFIVKANYLNDGRCSDCDQPIAGYWSQDVVNPAE